MIITEENLIKEYGARKNCEGLELFQEYFPQGFDTEDYDLDMQIWILTKTELREYLGWAYTCQIIPLYSMRKLDLSNVNLKWANLPRADLSRANLTGASLVCVKFKNADLSGANLSNANLTNTNFKNADLSNANLSRANLKRINIAGANLTGANLADADLNGIYLFGVNLSNTIVTKEYAKSFNCIYDEQTVFAEG